MVLFVVHLVRGALGTGGLIATGAVLGLTAVDALTISMAKGAASGLAPVTAAQAIAVGIAANCVMKAAIAVALGTREFGRRTGSVLAAMAVVLAAAVGATARFGVRLVVHEQAQVAADAAALMLCTSRRGGASPAPSA